MDFYYQKKIWVHVSMDKQKRKCGVASFAFISTSDAEAMCVKGISFCVWNIEKLIKQAKDDVG